MADAWDPTNSSDRVFKSRFGALLNSTDKVVIQTEAGKPNRFVLRSKGFFDLQAYVLSGRGFPVNSGAFDNELPMSGFKKLATFDGQIYNETKYTIIAIGSACSNYHRNHLAELVTAGQIAIQFSDTIVELLEMADELNLRHKFDILLNEKYTSKDKFDYAYKEAKEAAQIALESLKNEAIDKGKVCDRIVQRLISFKDDTIQNLNRVHFLTKQYRTGPVENGSTDPAHKTPYLDYLNKDLADSLVRFNALVKDTQDKYGDWENNTTVAVCSRWFGAVGWTVMGVDAAAAGPLRDSHDELQKQISQLAADRKEEANLIILINQMIEQCTDIDSKMSTAITAMTELGALFNTQAEVYSDLGIAVSRIEPDTDVEYLRRRKVFIERALKTSIEKLKELKDVAQDFTRSILNQQKF